MGQEASGWPFSGKTAVDYAPIPVMCVIRASRMRNSTHGPMLRFGDQFSGLRSTRRGRSKQGSSGGGNGPALWKMATSEDWALASRRLRRVDGSRLPSSRRRGRRELAPTGRSARRYGRTRGSDASSAPPRPRPLRGSVPSSGWRGMARGRAGSAPRRPWSGCTPR